jgi:hypothetical protein
MSGKITLTAAQLADLQKSPLTWYYSTTPYQLGPEGLWHTPSKKVPHKQKLPDY